MATITVLNEQLMSRSGARAKLDQTKEGMGIRPKPRWGTLYILGVLGGCLLFAGEALFVSAVWRGVWDVATVGVTFGAMAIWVSANRIALALEGGEAITAEAPEEKAGKPLRSHPFPMVRKRAA
jgi:hypothetical protein